MKKYIALSILSAVILLTNANAQENSAIDESVIKMEEVQQVQTPIPTENITTAPVEQIRQNDTPIVVEIPKTEFESSNTKDLIKKDTALDKAIKQNEEITELTKEDKPQEYHSIQAERATTQSEPIAQEETAQKAVSQDETQDKSIIEAGSIKEEKIQTIPARKKLFSIFRNKQSKDSAEVETTKIKPAVEKEEIVPDETQQQKE